MLYEIMYIIPSRYSDTEVEGIQKDVRAVMEKAGAEHKEEQNLGKIKFAYPIKKERHGTYILTYVEIDTQKVAKLDFDLRLTDQVLRHVIVSREDGIPKFDFTIGTYTPPINSEGRRASQDRKKEASRSKKTLAEKVKVSAEEVDKKLDEILEKDTDTTK